VKRAVTVTVCAAFSLALSQPMFAQIPHEQRSDAVKYLLKNFWGNAIDSKGRPIEPATDAERSTVPVSAHWVDLAFDAGEVSGSLEWCGMDWIPTLRALTSRARSEGMSDRQVAFVTVLHGANQGSIRQQRRARQCRQSDIEVAMKLRAELLARSARSGA
jgi:hypothetical protein